MGHYRSEMGLDDRLEAEQKARTREATAQRIRDAIREEGIEYVLADLAVEGGAMFSILYRRHDQ